MDLAREWIRRYFQRAAQDRGMMYNNAFRSFIQCYKEFRCQRSDRGMLITRLIPFLGGIQPQNLIHQNTLGIRLHIPPSQVQTRFQLVDRRHYS